MPKPSLVVLSWSEKHQHYEPRLRGQLQQRFHPGDDEAFSHWLDEQASFAFVGQTGRLSLIKEGRSAGSGYWYAYWTQNRHTRKRYLGASVKVTFARFEQAALVLSRPSLSTSKPPGEMKGILELRFRLSREKLSFL